MGFFVEKPVHITGQLLDARAISLYAANRTLGLLANLGRIAFDERLRLHVPRRVRIRRAGAQQLCVLNLDLPRPDGLANT